MQGKTKGRARQGETTKAGRKAVKDKTSIRKTTHTKNKTKQHMTS
jgi:hypothetical protein